MPLYQQISDELLTQITTARLRPGDRLPSERKLMRQYQASDTSVRRALAILRDSGYIEKKHGSGNYVLDKVLIGGTSGKTRVLVVGHGQFGRHVGMASLLENLGRKFEGVRTLALDTPVIEADQLKQLLHDYDCPILMLNSRNQTAAMAREGLLTNLEQIPALHGLLSRVADNVQWKFTGPDGQKGYYGCPYLYVTSAMSINLELADAAGLAASSPPRTWDELLDWCRRFTDWRRSTGRHDLQATYFNGIFRSYLFMATDGHPFSLAGEALSRAIGEYLSFYDRLIAMEAIEPVGYQVPDPFVSGKYLFGLQACPWLPRDTSRFRPDLRYLLLPPPVPAPGRPRFTGIGTALLAVAVPPGQENRLKMLQPILQEMLSPEWYINLGYNLGGAPADLAVFRQMVRQMPDFAPFYDAIFTSMEPHCPVDERLEEHLDAVIRQRFIARTAPLSESLAEYSGFYEQTIGCNI